MNITAKPYTMTDGKVTAIKVITDTTEELIQINPVEIDEVIIVADTIRQFYESKLELGEALNKARELQDKYNRANHDFQAITKQAEPKPTPAPPRPHVTTIPIIHDEPKPILPPKRVITTSPTDEPLHEEPIAPQLPEPEIEPPSPLPKTIENHANDIIKSDRFQALLKGKNFSLDNVREIVRDRCPEHVDRITDIIIESLKTQGLIEEPSAVDKLINIIKKRKKLT